MKYTFRYKGVLYECLDENRDFQLFQFNAIIKNQDWVTMENRITNQLKSDPYIRIVEDNKKETNKLWQKL